jgi:hypothetical protein
LAPGRRQPAGRRARALWPGQVKNPCRPGDECVKGCLDHLSRDRAAQTAIRVCDGRKERTGGRGTPRFECCSALVSPNRGIKPLLQFVA